MEKYKMSLIPALLLILHLKSGLAEELTPSERRSNEISPTEAYGQGEVMDPVVIPESSQIFRREEKVEIAPPTSSKTETVDISPKLAAGDDEDIFWEVTKVPESRLTEGTTRSDFVDGNHPDVYEVITHDHVDRTTGQSGQSKRVKKILPPFDGKRDEDSVGRRNTRNISKAKIIAIKVSDLREINHGEGKVDTPKLKSPDGNETEKPENGTAASADKPETWSSTIIPGVDGTTPQTKDLSSGGVERNSNEKSGSNVREKGSSDINMRGEFSSGGLASATEAFSKTFTTGPQTKNVDVAPDWKNSKTTQPTEWNGTENYGDLRVRNPEFLLVPEKVDSELDKSETVKTTTEKEQEQEEEEEEIRGIPLVPKEFGKSREESTTQRSIWELLRERMDTTDRTTQKTLYQNFDADSAEVEYETENFQHGYSNIEKHELPFSYALPWLEVKDKGYQMKVRKEKKTIHTKINDFPSVLPANKNYFQNGEEAQLSKDLSKILKLSRGENSVNGVTVSIVDSGTNHEDISRYGHRPSKWYLLLLTGNSTIVKLRRKDFTKYLKLNLAARLSVEYDDIKVNKVILAPPKVLVNISVYAPSDDIAEESQFDLREKFEDKGEAPLYKLAETNATLLELSGEEYHVVRFLSLQSQKPEAEAHKDSVPNSIAIRHDDVEFVVYTFIGSVCACAIILTFFVTFGRHFKKLSDYRWPWKKVKTNPIKPENRTVSDQDEFNGISPAVIYSGGFPQIRGSWMTGIGTRSHPPAETPGSSILKNYPGIELGMSQTRKKGNLYPEIENRSCSSPRRKKLQIYNSGASNLVLPVPPQKISKKSKGECRNTHPLDVRIPINGIN